MLPQAFAKMLSCFGCHCCSRFVVKRFVVMMMMMTTTVSEILVKIMMAMIMVVILIAKSMWLPRLWLMRRTLKVSISNMPLPSASALRYQRNQYTTSKTVHSIVNALHLKNDTDLITKIGCHHLFFIIEKMTILFKILDNAYRHRYPEPYL